METMLYQGPAQINGANAHKAVDEGNYSKRFSEADSVYII
jgi:hypothetical protein